MKPIWNEDIDFEMKTVSQATSTVRIGVWDEDIKFHDEIGADIFTFPHFYNNGAGQPEAKYLLFNNKQESIGTITLKTSYVAVLAPVAPKAEEKKSSENLPAPKVEAKKEELPLPRPKPIPISENDDVINFTFKGADIVSDTDFFTKIHPIAEIQFVGL